MFVSQANYVLWIPVSHGILCHGTFPVKTLIFLLCPSFAIVPLDFSQKNEFKHEIKRFKLTTVVHLAKDETFWLWDLGNCTFITLALSTRTSYLWHITIFYATYCCLCFPIKATLFLPHWHDITLLIEISVLSSPTAVQSPPKPQRPTLIINWLAY